MKLLFLLCCICSLFLGSSLPLKGESKGPDRKITYKELPEGKNLDLHIFLPEGHKAGDKRASVVFFFGGGWLGGTPKQFYKQCKHFASRGMVAISADYRTKKSHSTPPSACVQDGKSAIRYIRENASSLGLDPKLICAGGGSAGGHVAAAAATLEGFNEPGESTEVSCVPAALVLFNPVYDTSEAGYGYDRVASYWESFSPHHNLSADTPPTITFLGDKDKHISVAIAESYRDKMLAFGVRSDLHIFKDQLHGFFNKAKYKETLQLADEFLVSLGFLEALPSGTK